MGGCDIVLGIQWLRTLGPIIWDFLKLTMAFSWRGTQVLLQGLKPIEFIVEDGPKFFRSSNKGVVLQLIVEEETKEALPENSIFEDLLMEFQGIFEEPKGLPPIRSHDHRILLKNDSKPVCARPYRYHYFQRTEIEKIVRDLLNSGGH